MTDGVVEVGRLMVHPTIGNIGYRKLLAFVDEQMQLRPACIVYISKSWINIKLYTKMGYKAVKRTQDDTGYPL